MSQRKGLPFHPVTKLNSLELEQGFTGMSYACPIALSILTTALAVPESTERWWLCCKPSLVNLVINQFTHLSYSICFPALPQSHLG